MEFSCTSTLGRNYNIKYINHLYHKKEIAKWFVNWQEYRNCQWYVHAKNNFGIQCQNICKNGFFCFTKGYLRQFNSSSLKNAKYSDSFLKQILEMSNLISSVVLPFFYVFITDRIKSNFGYMTSGFFFQLRKFG